jgi:hypothetical protein
MRDNETEAKLPRAQCPRSKIERGQMLDGPYLVRSGRKKQTYW